MSQTVGRKKHVASETSEPAHTFILLHPVTPPNPTQTVTLGARLIQGFLRGPDERTGRMLVLCPSSGVCMTRPSLGLGPGPQRT